MLRSVGAEGVYLLAFGTGWLWSWGCFDFSPTCGSGHMSFPDTLVFLSETPSSGGSGAQGEAFAPWLPRREAL